MPNNIEQTYILYSFKKMSISWFIYFTQQLLLASLQIGVDLGLGRRITLSKLKI
jgi:hypothetical protein